MDKIKSILIVAFLILSMLACSAIQGVNNPPPSQEGGNPAPAVEPTQGGEAAPPPGPATASSGSLWVQVLSPLDGAVLNTPQVDVAGRAPADTVVTVNDEILLVGADQQFKTTVPLDEGPNLIEIVASDLQGNEVTLELTVTYEP